MSDYLDHLPPIDPVERSIDLLKQSDTRVLVALAGLPGSGKSTLAGQIVHDLNRTLGDGTAVGLGMDGFHLPKSVLAAMPEPEAAMKRRGAPWTFDSFGFYHRVCRVVDGYHNRPVSWPGFEHGVGDPVDNAIVVGADVRFVLIEGLYLLCDDGAWGEAHSLFNERWYLDTPIDESLERLAQRHVRTPRITREAAMRQIGENDRLNAEIVIANRLNADKFVIGRHIQDERDNSA